MRAYFVSDSDDYSYANRHPDAQCNAKRDTLSDCDGYSHRDTFADASTGLEHLDPVAG